MKAYELLEKEENWTKGSFCKRKDNKYRSTSILESKKEECCFCVEGALIYCYGIEPIAIINNLEEHQLLQNSIPEEYKKRIPDWNDDPKTTHEEVYNLLKQLDI